MAGRRPWAGRRPAASPVRTGGRPRAAAQGCCRQAAGGTPEGRCTSDRAGEAPLRRCRGSRAAGSRGSLLFDPQVGPDEVARIGTRGSPGRRQHRHDVEPPGCRALHRSGCRTRSEFPPFAPVAHHDVDRVATVSEQHLPQCVPYGSAAVTQSVRHQFRVDAHCGVDQARHAPSAQHLPDLPACLDHGERGACGDPPQRSGPNDLTVVRSKRTVHDDSRTVRPPVRA